MEYITSRNFNLPESESEMDGHSGYNMWRSKLGPYKTLAIGDKLYWYESANERIVWETWVVDVDAFSYDRKENALTRLEARFGSFSKDEPYYLKAPDIGNCLAYKVQPIRRLNLPKPDGLRFPQSGWLRGDDPAAQRWLASTSGPKTIVELRDLIEQIAASWSDYRSKVTVDKGDPVYAMVTRQFPQALRPHVEDYESILVQGSTGAGNITAAPWIALFDRRLTTSATTEYYIVYLFSSDLSTVTLSLAFGTTQFEEQFGGPSDAFPQMRLAAARLQEMFNHLIPENLARGTVDLRAGSRQKLHYAYQQATILSYPPYRIGALPGELKLAADLRELVRIYTAIVSDPLEATVERLLESVIEPAVRVESIELRDFEVRPPRTDRELRTSRGAGRRYSPQSLKVGDAGERAVMRHEQERLARSGRQDLADRVRWHAQQREFVGWDITSFDDNGDEVYIEVKSSIGKSISCVALTVNEWQAACHVGRRHRYFVYIVTEALSATPRIERLQNPASYVDDGRLSCEAIVYELQLSPPTTKSEH